MLNEKVSGAVQKSLVDKKTGLPIDGIDGTRCPCPALPPPDIQVGLEFGRTLDHQMVQMGAIVTARNRAACVNGRSARLADDPLPYHEKVGDGQND